MNFSIYRKIDDDFYIDGKKYTLNASFDNILKVIELSNDDFSGVTKLVTMVTMLFGEQLEGYDLKELKEIMDVVLQEYIDSKHQAEYDDLGNEVPQPETGEDKRLMDIDHDADAIYSSFMQAYGIDLHKELGQMHWYTFKALLNGLPEGTRMREIISIRGYKKPSKSDNHHIQMLKLQHAYALPTKTPEDEEEEGVDYV